RAARRRPQATVRGRKPRHDGGDREPERFPGGRGDTIGAAGSRSNSMTGGTGGMKKDEPRSTLAGSRKEGEEPAEERMEDWFRDSVTSEFEEGEVVHGRVVHVGTSEVLVDVGYKSEGTIPIEEFHRHGTLPKVGDEIEVYLEAKEDSEGLIVLSKDKADKIKVWDAITQAYEKGAPVEGRVVEVVKGGLAVDVGVKRSEEHTSELQSPCNLVCRLLLEK